MRKEIIGDATLYLGDCMEVMADMPDKSVDAVVTDPPYGMNFVSNYRKLKYKPIENDSSEDCLKFTCSIKASHSKYIFCRWENIASVKPPKSIITWVKNNWSMGDLKHEHSRQTELILFYDGPDHIFPKGRPTDVIFENRTGNEFHPTEKPIFLMMKIVNFTKGVVVDPFMGSGTTGVACMELGRKFIGIEKEPKYFDIACKRIDMAERQGKLFADAD